MIVNMERRLVKQAVRKAVVRFPQFSVALNCVRCSVLCLCPGLVQVRRLKEAPEEKAYFVNSTVLASDIGNALAEKGKADGVNYAIIASYNAKVRLTLFSFPDVTFSLVLTHWLFYRQTPSNFPLLTEPFPLCRIGCGASPCGHCTVERTRRTRATCRRLQSGTVVAGIRRPQGCGLTLRTLRTCLFGIKSSASLNSDKFCKGESTLNTIPSKKLAVTSTWWLFCIVGRAREVVFKYHIQG